jgi:hypothetical protein
MQMQEPFQPDSERKWTEFKNFSKVAANKPQNPVMTYMPNS